MSSHRSGQALADAFVVENESLIRFVEGCSDDLWQTLVENEGRTVGVLAHHMAVIPLLITGWVEKVAAGTPLPPITMDDIDHANAHHAAREAGCSQDEVIKLLRENGAAVAARLAALDTESLDRTGALALLGDQPTSARQIAEIVLIAHNSRHLKSIEAVLPA